MAETQSKRQREETHELEAVGETCDITNAHTNKRQKYSYNDILSFLDSSEESEEPSQDLSSLITTLQQELFSSDSGFDPLHASGSEPDPENLTSSPALKEDDRESVMRRLLEASDDELGIPNTNDASFCGDRCGEGFDGLRLTDQGLWELEDEAAFYYTLLQSELCM